MTPKRYICGLYKNDLTLRYVSETGIFVLQLLAANQANLVNLLGKKSGNSIDKIARLNRRKLTGEWGDFVILKQALSLIKLKVVETFDAGDHMGFMLDVIEFKNINIGEPLTMNHLREKKIVRA
jgi:flavin reductase (DIM6/NTAB) family NADH-FMN oxidoreductase RutF